MDVERQEIIAALHHLQEVTAQCWVRAVLDRDGADKELSAVWVEAVALEVRLGGSMDPAESFLRRIVDGSIADRATQAQSAANAQPESSADHPHGVT